MKEYLLVNITLYGYTLSYTNSFLRFNSVLLQRIGLDKFTHK